MKSRNEFLITIGKQLYKSKLRVAFSFLILSIAALFFFENKIIFILLLLLSNLGLMYSAYLVDLQGKVIDELKDLQNSSDVGFKSASMKIIDEYSDESKAFSKYLLTTSNYLLNLFNDQFKIATSIKSHSQSTSVLLSDVGTKLERVTSSSNLAKQAADNGSGNLQKLSASVESLDEIGKLLMNFTEINNSLYRQMSEIDSVVFMAKLLSFNATVEAARFGELGGGMSVVALEMTKLANQIGNTSKSIQVSLKQGNTQLVTFNEKVNHLLKDTTGLISSSQDSFQSIINEIYSFSSQIHHVNESLTNYRALNQKLDEIIEQIVKTSNTLGTASSNTNLVRLDLEETFSAEALHRHADNM